MPRNSLADRLDRASLSRGSAGKGSLGRYSIATDVSGSGSVSTRHWVNSVSDIYGPDEIEELLEDLNRLELAAFETDDIQDFDIDGSQLGQEAAGAGARYYGHRRRSGGAAGRSSRRRYPHPHPLQASAAHNPAASPTFSVRSWDSHARYQSPFEDEYEGVEVGPLPSAPPHLHPAHHPRLRGDLPPGGHDDYDGGGGGPLFRTDPADPADPADGLDCGGAGDSGSGGAGDDVDIFPSRPRKSILCYCDTSTLRTPKTILRVILVFSSLACLCAVLACGSSPAPPHPAVPADEPAVSPEQQHLQLLALSQLDPRLRVMLFICIFTLLFTVFVLFLYISHLIAVMPGEIAKMQTVAYLLLTLAFSVSSSLLLQVHLAFGGQLAARRAGGGGAEPNGGEEQRQFSFWTKYHLLIAALLGFLCGFECFLCIWNCGRHRPGGGGGPDDSQAYDKILQLQESSTHFTLQQETNLSNTRQHNTNTNTNGELVEEERGATDAEQTQQLQGPPKPLRQQQYLVNENFNQQQPNAAAAAAAKAKYNQKQPQPGEAAQGTVPPSIPPPPTAAAAPAAAKLGGEPPTNHNRTGPEPPKAKDDPGAKTLHHALVEATVKSTMAPGRNTGAIPKQKKKQQSAATSSPPKAVNNHLDEIVSVPLDDAGDAAVTTTAAVVHQSNGGSKSGGGVTQGTRH